MSEIRWSRQACRDYFNIIQRLDEKNPVAARRIAGALFERVTQLKTMPRIGRNGRIAGTRELVIVRTPYVIVYRVENDGETVGIARVLHGAQRWPPR